MIKIDTIAFLTNFFRGFPERPARTKQIFNKMFKFGILERVLHLQVSDVTRFSFRNFGKGSPFRSDVTFLVLKIESLLGKPNVDSILFRQLLVAL